MIFILEEDKSSDYPARTEVNAKEADATIAIAVNFESPGEKLTKKLVLKHNNLYIPVAPNGDINMKADKIVEFINKRFSGIKDVITLNIAGNGIYTMKGVMTQEECDEFTYNLLNKIINHKDFLIKVKSIRSGAQTGFDTSGIKAGIKLRIDTIAYYPKGCRIKDLNGDRTQTREEVLKQFGVSPKQEIFD